jgi:hypothetical protein
MCIQIGKLLIESLTRKLLLETVEILNIKKFFFAKLLQLRRMGKREKNLGQKSNRRKDFYCRGRGQNSGCIWRRP